MSAIQPVCLSVCTLSFDGLKSLPLKKCFSDVNLYEARLSVCTLSFDGLKSPLLKNCFRYLNLYEEAVNSSGLVVQLKLKCLLMKLAHGDIIEAKGVYSQLSFERLKGS